jgi:NAD(P)-dependent dehydrogenase (short-subunit alcohol dehydrogenase family)
MSEYANKVVVITGAGAGIGKAIACGYAKLEAQVILIDKDEDLLLETKLFIQSTGGLVQEYVFDLSNGQEIGSLFQQIEEKFSRIDVLINNAGLGKSKSPYELDIADWDYVINTNLRGTFLCAREAAAIMKKNGGGAIINMASTRAFMSEENTEAYAASKGGIVSLTHALAISLAADRITVNVISPGWIETGEYDNLRLEDHLQHPSARVGKPDDVFRACVYLTDPRNNFVNGINLMLDGGMTKKMIYED